MSVGASRVLPTACAERKDQDVKAAMAGKPAQLARGGA